MADVPYQLKPQITQLRNERANAEAYGNTARVEAIDNELDALGVRREAGQRRQAAAEESGSPQQARQQAPQGRTTPPKTQTATPGDEELERLRKQAEVKGIAVDKRWGTDRLQQEIDKASKVQ